MFKTIFLLQLKSTLKNKGVIMWLLAFPLVLGTVFFLSFGTISHYTSFELPIVNVVVENNNNIVESFLDDISNYNGEKSEDDILFVEGTNNYQMATEKLGNGQINAIIIIDGDNTKIIVDSTVQASIVESVFSIFESNKSTLNNLLIGKPQQEYAQIISSAMAELQKDVQAVVKRNVSKNDANQNVIYFFSLIAMTCLYFSMAGKEVISMTQPNQSMAGRRQSITPVQRWKLLLIVYLANFVAMIAVMAIVLTYFTVVLQINFGHIGYVILTCLVSILMALGFGMLVSSLIAKKDAVKEVFLIMITMVMSFTNGLMSAPIKAAIMSNVPWLNWINPCALITDCFYALFYYDTLTMFFTKLGCIAIYAVVFTVATALIVRRKKYANI